MATILDASIPSPAVDTSDPALAMSRYAFGGVASLLLADGVGVGRSFAATCAADLVDPLDEAAADFRDRRERFFDPNSFVSPAGTPSNPVPFQVRSSRYIATVTECWRPAARRRTWMRPVVRD